MKNTGKGNNQQQKEHKDHAENKAQRAVEEVQLDADAEIIIDFDRDDSTEQDLKNNLQL